MAIPKKTKEFTDVDAFELMQTSPIFFAEVFFALAPQPLKPEYQVVWKLGLTSKGADWQTFCDSIREDWFQPFVHGKHITWQQFIILTCIEKALNGEASNKISIVSGRGIGKSSILALIILWFLFCYPDSQIPCTAVTKDQLDEALWKELAIWLAKMPEAIQAKLDLSGDHLRMKESKDTWFARARTASKDRPEALSGVHAEWILAIIDEASAVHEKVFEMGQGILTSPHPFWIMISNGTVNDGFFYRSHHENRGAYQCLSFNSSQSPIVNLGYIKSIIDDYCIGVRPQDYHTVTEYRVNVLGLFPQAGIMDDKGYVPLLADSQILNHEGEEQLIGHRIMGVDCAGEGDDKSVWCVRDRNKAIIVHEEQVSTPSGIAEKTITLAEKYGIKIQDYRDIIIDGFGSGMNVAQEIALMTKGIGRVTAVNVGEKCENEFDRAEFMNQRAEAYWKARQWLLKSGTIGVHTGLRKDLLNIRYRSSAGRKQIEPKLDMKKRGIKSPDYADAFAMTFLRNLFTELKYDTPKLPKEFDAHSTYDD